MMQSTESGTTGARSAASLEKIPFELRSLASARNYQAWVFRKVEPFLGKRILELGAGIGNMSRWLPLRERLILTESEPALCEMLRDSLADRAADPRVTTQSFDLAKSDLAPYIAENLDTIVSFNVLEHIEDDAAALARLCEILRASKAPGPKRLVTFVPAHSWAYGAMDKSFGHYRRYSRGSLGSILKSVAPEAKHTFSYFNVVGLAGWIVNGRILGKSQIGMGSIDAFERLCPIVSPIDDLLHKHLKLPMGQSLVSVVEWG
jgi:SAM-dependent methyltransferase